MAGNKYCYDEHGIYKRKGSENNKKLKRVFYQEDEFSYSGQPVNINGQVTDKRISFDKERWQKILSVNDSVLGIHIPEGSPMDYSMCGESLVKAVKFFKKYFPCFKYFAFCCVSWFWDSNFENYLNNNSNIISFMREGLLFPVPDANDKNLLQRVFNLNYVDNINALPKDTSLRRAIVQHMQTGGSWKTGGLLIFPEDLNWGSNYYRKNNITEN